jgi:hypothetical protein
MNILSVLIIICCNNTQHPSVESIPIRADTTGIDIVKTIINNETDEMDDTTTTDKVTMISKDKEEEATMIEIEIINETIAKTDEIINDPGEEWLYKQQKNTLIIVMSHMIVRMTLLSGTTTIWMIMMNGNSCGPL